MIEEGYLRSNLKTVLEDENFDRFDEKTFSDKKGKEQRSPRENILLVRDHCLEYVASFDRSEESILFVGAVGTGKTFMSHCIAKALLDSGRTVVYFTAYDLVDRVADFSFGNADASEKELVLDSDLLIVDDLGCERQTEFAQSALFNVLNERLVRGKKMLISTNLSTKEIKDVYNSRFFSRLIGNFTGFKFIGADLRVHEKN
jgi:DNA replication protein DnaC